MRPPTGAATSRPASPGIDSVAPATFAELVAKADPKLPFVAWATHPVPSDFTFGPTQKVAFPNVGFSTMTEFGESLAKWFQPARADLGDRVRRA